MADESSAAAAAVAEKKPEEKKSWADEAEEESAASAASSDAKNGEGEKPEEELKKIESLSISDSPDGPQLDDPDDSDIKALPNSLLLSPIETLKLPTRLTPLKNPNPRFKIRSSYTPTPSTDRLISALSYALPFVNSIAYGRFLFSRFPLLLPLVSPFFPFLSVLHSVPFAGFVAFFALYLGVVRNPSISRFNSMQAVVLDILLAIPSLLQRVFGVPTRGVGLKVMEFGYDAIFLFAAGCFVYSVVSCVLGRMPYLPIVATAADRQL